MNRCPITYELCGTERYSQKGLKLLSKTLTHLKDFPYSAKEQVQIATQLASKLSIQGVQPKLSVSLNVKEQTFQIMERKGKFIIKPPHLHYDEVPENEDLTMRLAELIGLEVPLHGLIYNMDGTFSYFIKRFDRTKSKKLALEDFSQLLGDSRETKYESSMEKVALVLQKHCTFPVIEKLKLFRLIIFNFLIGNEDCHLKNFSLIRRENRVELSPCYDLLNTTILLKNPKEEIALPIAGKKSKLSKELFSTYGIERLGFSEQILANELTKFQMAIDRFENLIQQSFLSDKMKLQYKNLLHERQARLFA